MLKTFLATLTVLGSLEAQQVVAPTPARWARRAAKPGAITT